ncbi:MAG: hypothetical protein D3925_01805 [Candidatus Electrothrix sp. AR5]|nr:hypothetical protein [Candidatus Electrothrix sp. AR5]
MKKFFSAVIILIITLISISPVCGEIKESDRERGGSDLQNVHDRVLCVDGFKVFQTIVFGFVKDGGAAVSNIQLMEEKEGRLVPVRCSE